MTELATRAEGPATPPQGAEPENHSACPTGSGRARWLGLSAVGGLFAAGVGLGLWGLIPLSFVLYGALFLACPLVHLLGGHKH